MCGGAWPYMDAPDNLPPAVSRTKRSFYELFTSPRSLYDTYNKEEAREHAPRLRMSLALKGVERGFLWPMRLSTVAWG
jgi:hypothetical protein